MGKIDDIYQVLLANEDCEKGITAAHLSQVMQLDRANVSRYLNRLCEDGLIEKLNGRPVFYRSFKRNSAVSTVKEAPVRAAQTGIDAIVGARLSLQVPIQQAKAAILYPPRGLHTLILGETGVGKSMFAESMFEFARESGVIASDAPFVRFNCADYADNPQLVMAQIFGVKKGAYSGADSDRDGLLKLADHGIFFLDEVHRLTPQGQEMLFTFIDKGFFRPLGETNRLVHADVQIIAATTEDPQSHLLKTFTRRIPMTVTLPSLNERSLQERYFLLEQFIRSEARRLQKDIYVQYNALISLLLYDCPNNIGQLKSDIQLACAKAFLRFKAENRHYILIDQPELHVRVKRGLMNLQERRREVESLLNHKEDIRVFSHLDDVDIAGVSESETAQKNEHFYDIIERKMEELKCRGLSEREINELLNVDIEGYFQKYIRNLPGKFRKEEIAKVVDREIVEVVEEILEYAQQQLEREYDEKVYYGLALHLNKSIDRLRQGTYIYHPNLDKIRKRCADEFMTAIRIAKIIESKLNIEIPLDEIGYITMFLAADSYLPELAGEQKVQILVIMHGHATASSMAQVANTLLGEKHAHSLDMALNMKVEDMYELTKKKVQELPSERGVLLLVDMGSLNNFADMLMEDAGIRVKSVDMVSTPVVIEACHKAMEGNDLEAVYRSCKEVRRYRIQVNTDKKTDRAFLIVTACFTGEGAALRLKEILEQSEQLKEAAEIKAMDILDRNDFLCRMQELGRRYQILAVVGTVSFQLDQIPFFTAADILAGKGIEEMERLVGREQEYLKIKASLKNHIRGIDAGKLVEDVRRLIGKLERDLYVAVPEDVKIGILLHICFMVDKIVNHGTAVTFSQLADYRQKHQKSFSIAAAILGELEQMYKMELAEDELAYIVKMMLENDSTVMDNRQ